MTKRKVPEPQLALLQPAPEHNPARLRKFNVDRTPRPVVRQGLLWLLRRPEIVLPPEPVVLDCCAGEGAFPAEIKALLPKSIRVAVEPREECAMHLRRHAHEVITDYFVRVDGESVIEGCEVPKAHLIVTNPPFSLSLADAGDGETCAEEGEEDDPDAADEDKAVGERQQGKRAKEKRGKSIPLWLPIWQRARSLLLPGGAVMFLGLNEIGQRGKPQHAGWQQSPPSHQARIAGPIRFRGLRCNADLRNYSWWVVTEAHVARVPAVPQLDNASEEDEIPDSGAEWPTCDLPWLPSECRQWREIPGTEADR